jgi:hypothetical protein
MMRRLVFLVVVAAMAVLVSSAVANADPPLPTGERSFHNATLEPFYNAEQAGQIGYLLTPNKAPMKANPAAWSPLYIVVYPVGTTAATTLNCMHVPVENCPSHGDEVAAGAEGIAAANGWDTYQSGVLGHDHVGDFPGGADFNFAWEPVLVVFTSAQAANEHLVTDTQIENAVKRGDAITVDLPQLTFNCASVSPVIWGMATPVAG